MIISKGSFQLLLMCLENSRWKAWNCLHTTCHWLYAFLFSWWRTPKGMKVWFLHSHLLLFRILYLFNKHSLSNWRKRWKCDQLVGSLINFFPSLFCALKQNVFNATLKRQPVFSSSGLFNLSSELEFLIMHL